MRVIVCGTRKGMPDPKPLAYRLAMLPTGSTVIEGGQYGVDRQAREAAEVLGIRCETFRADWGVHGSAAGPNRNQRMLDSGADLVLAYPGEGSKGTWDMVRRAIRHFVPVEVHRNGTVTKYP